MDVSAIDDAQTTMKELTGYTALHLNSRKEELPLRQSPLSFALTCLMPNV